MKRHWFKAKIYGWGWYPATWEGWVILGIYIFIVWTAVHLTRMIFGHEHFIVPYVIAVFTITAILLIITVHTGEKPEWRWGKKKKKKS